MTRAYTLNDTAPKDAAGSKFLAWPDTSVSQLDFALPAGIGACTLGITSKIHAALQVGTHLAGSKIDSAIVGVVNLLAFTATSSVGMGAAVPQRGDQSGAIYTTALSTTTCAMNCASTETMTTNSGTLYRVLCAGCGVIAGGQVAILNGAVSIAHFVFSGANESLPILDLGNHGTCFGSLRIEKRGTIGAVYVSMNYNSTYSQ